MCVGCRVFLPRPYKRGNSYSMAKVYAQEQAEIRSTNGSIQDDEQRETKYRF